MCFWGSEIERQNKDMEGDIDIYGGGRGKNISCTRCIDFNVDGDF